MRKYLLGLSLILATVASPVFADEAAEKMTLAKEYSKLVPVADEIDVTIEQMALQVPVAQRVLFKSILKRTIKVDRLQMTSELALSELFTVKELQALINLYKTPEGRSIKNKMPDYQARLQPVLTQMVRDAASALAQQTK